MLKKGVIPDREPMLRVGVVLPEDNFKQIKITVPSDFGYIAVSENGEQIAFSTELNFSLHNGSILANKTLAGSKWTLTAREKETIKPGIGFRVHDLIAGRGFHWQKNIDMFLPDKLELTVANNVLLLINELPLEYYLMCVATSEMGSACPAALIEAQTIVARSWMLANVEQKHINLGMDVCNDDCCQRYQGTGNLSEHSQTGAMNTFGQVLMYQGKICDARYSKSCGGIMERYATIWGDSELPYLMNIIDGPESRLPIASEQQARSWIDSVPETYCSPHFIPENNLKQYLGNVDEQGSYFRWQVHYTQEEITDLLNKRLNLDASRILALKPVKRGGSGRIIQLKIVFKSKDNRTCEYFVDRDVKIRQALHEGFLYSSCIYITNEPDNAAIPRSFTIHGAGWGHGVGLCQIGALGMALKNFSAEQIVTHYYPGCEIVRIY